MAKLTRTDLKEIVKECLIEILDEGIRGSAPNEPQTMRYAVSEGPSRKNSQRKRSRNKNAHPALDSISYGTRKTRKSRQVNEQFDTAVNNVANALTDDPIMAELFKDTARTTLQEQMSSEGASPMVATSMQQKQGLDHAARTVADTDDISGLFGNAGKWADLAFASPVDASKKII